MFLGEKAFIDAFLGKGAMQKGLSENTAGRISLALVCKTPEYCKVWESNINYLKRWTNDNNHSLNLCSSRSSIGFGFNCLGNCSNLFTALTIRGKASETFYIDWFLYNGQNFQKHFPHSDGMSIPIKLFDYISHRSKYIGDSLCKLTRNTNATDYADYQNNEYHQSNHINSGFWLKFK